MERLNIDIWEPRAKNNVLIFRNELLIFSKVLEFFFKKEKNLKKKLLRDHFRLYEIYYSNGNHNLLNRQKDLINNKSANV